MADFLGGGGHARDCVPFFVRLNFKISKNVL